MTSALAAMPRGEVKWERRMALPSWFVKSDPSSPPPPPDPTPPPAPEPEPPKLSPLEKMRAKQSSQQVQSQVLPSGGRPVVKPTVGPSPFAALGQNKPRVQAPSVPRSAAAPAQAKPQVEAPKEYKVYRPRTVNGETTREPLTLRAGSRRFDIRKYYVPSGRKNKKGEDELIPMTARAAYLATDKGQVLRITQTRRGGQDRYSVYSWAAPLTSAPWAQQQEPDWGKVGETMDYKDVLQILEGTYGSRAIAQDVLEELATRGPD